MNLSLQSLQSRAVSWHKQRFPKAKREHVALKLAEEVGEVAKAILSDVGRNSATGKGYPPDEMADVLICILVLMGRWYSPEDLEILVMAKLDVLISRTSGHSSALEQEG